jgi:Flp pilus assembly protein TadD
MFESHNDLGAVYFKNKDYVLAEASFATALRLRPEATASRFNLGLCYARQGRYLDAARELERAVQSTPDDALALYELGLCYERTGRTADAVRAFQASSTRAKSQELADKLAEGLGRLQGGGR